MDPPLQGCRQDSGNYHWIPDPSFTSPGIDNRQGTNAVSVMFVNKFCRMRNFSKTACGSGEKTGGLKVRVLLFTRVVRLFFRQDE